MSGLVEEENEIETMCKLFEVTRKLHEDNLRRIDDELGSDGCEVKMGVM
jgi:hypothetical protein